MARSYAGRQNSAAPRLRKVVPGVLSTCAARTPRCAFLMSSLAPTKERWALREVSEAAIRSRGPACHLGPLLLLLGSGDFGDLTGSSFRRRGSGRSCNAQPLCLDDRRRGRRPEHLGYSCRWRASLSFAGWRFEIHTPGEEQQGQQRAHIEKVL